MKICLKANNISKYYGKSLVVNNVALSLNQGEVVGLLGPNGAGKTTTFYMLVGIIFPNKGSIWADSTDITSWPLHMRARLGLSYLPQESSIFQKLTIKENLQIILEHTGKNKQQQKDQLDYLMQELGISNLSKQKAFHLSGGERRRLEIARALIRNPKFMLLDEPFAGVDPLAVEDIQRIVFDLQNKNIGVLISDHNVRETMHICDKVYLVYEGQIILEGTPDDIVSDTKAREVYLGEKFSL